MMKLATISCFAASAMAQLEYTAAQLSTTLSRRLRAEQVPRSEVDDEEKVGTALPKVNWQNFWQIDTETPTHSPTPSPTQSLATSKADSSKVDDTSYEPDFYIRGNIIGYTGTIGDGQTVYFMTMLNEYYIKHGRITTYYPRNAGNVGRHRTRVWEKSRYYMINEWDEDRGYRLVEYLGGRSWHKSRNAFIPVRQDELNVMGELAKAIDRFPSMKSGHDGIAAAHCVNTFLCDDFSLEEGECDYFRFETTGYWQCQDDCLVEVSRWQCRESVRM